MTTTPLAVLRSGPRAALQPRARVSFLDGVRFIAAGAVVFQHAVERQEGAGSDLVATLSPGVFGVVLFFLVSGFVIRLSTRGRFDVRNFAVRRLFRIYPMIIVTFAALAIVAYSGALTEFDYVKAASARDWVYNLLLVQDYTGATSLWGVTWTLSLEIAWYALFAVGVRFLGAGFERIMFNALSIMLLLLALMSIVLEHRLPLARLGMIYAALLGSLVFGQQVAGAKPSSIVKSILVFMLVMLICNVVSFGHFTHPHITVNQAVYPWIFAPLLFGLIVVVPAIRDSLVLSNRVLVWLGTISYSTYLLHPFAIGIAQGLPTAWSRLAATVGLTLVLSALAYYAVERPGQRAGRHFMAWLSSGANGAEGIRGRGQMP